MPSRVASSATRATAAKKSEASTAKATMAANTSKKRKSPVGDDVEDEVTDKMAKLNTAAAAKSGAGTNAVAKRTAVKNDAAAAPDAKKRKVAASGAAAKTASAKKPAVKKTAQLDESDKENEGAPKKAAAGKRKAPTPAPAAPAAAQTNGVADESQKDEDEDENDEQPGEKRQKKSPAPKEPAAKKRAVRRKTAVINTAPTDILDVFVFGEGSNGELGLGNAKIDGKKPRDVKRPRLNPNLAARTAKVVQIACGGMHVAALTADNKILTWGVNDMGALGRDTRWEGGTRDIDDEEDEDDGDDFSGMNPIESTPGEVDMSLVEPDTVFTQVVASDSATFAVTEEGRVYGWGTFRNDEGVLGFDKTTLIQKAPRLMPAPLTKIVQLAAGSNHVLALDQSGKVITWGAGQHDQLGRKTIVKRKTAHSFYTGEEGLTPAGISALPGKKRGEGKAIPAKVACGAYHSFILDTQGRVYSWGLNNYGELGIREDAGADNASNPTVRLVESLADYKVTDIDGGEHHSLCATDDGKLLTWGRIDGFQVGIPGDKLTEETAIYDEHGKPRILAKPMVVPDVPAVASVAGGTDHNLVITKDGQAYSWGFSVNYQTGQGTDDDVEVPTLIDNTAVRGRKLIYAGAGGQYSVLAAVSDEQ